MKQSLIFTGYACNENCFFCSAEVNGRKHINRKIKEILKDIVIEYNIGSRSIEFIGGEVLIRKDIFLILSFAKKIGFKKISIETNGTMLKDYNFCLKLLQSGLNNITMSIHGSNSKINDYHTNLVDSFDMKLKALKNLSKLKNNYDFNFSTNYVITSKNINNINAFLTLMNKYDFIDKNIFAFVRPIKSYKDNYYNYLPNFNSIKKVFENIESNKKVLIQYLPYCILDDKFHNIYLDYFSKGLKNNVNKINIEEKVSLENAIQYEETYFKECYICKYKNKCRGVWSEYVKYFNMTTPPLLIPIK